MNEINLKIEGKTFEIFKNFIGLLKTINEELTLHVDETGIAAAGMDPSHVAMIVGKVKAPMFESFECPEKTDITVNLTELLKFLDRVEKEEQVKIRYDLERARLVINLSKGGHRRRFELPVMEPMEEEIPEPKIAFKSEGRIMTQSVDKAIKDAGLVSEHIKFEFTGELMKFSAAGDMGSAASEWEKESDDLLQLESKEDSAATFTLSYLKDIITALKPMADVVALHLSADMPVKIVAEANNPNITAEIYLAPCIGT